MDKALWDEMKAEGGIPPTFEEFVEARKEKKQALIHQELEKQRIAKASQKHHASDSKKSRRRAVQKSRRANR